jgi:hypothetical protein
LGISLSVGSQVESQLWLFSIIFLYSALKTIHSLDNICLRFLLPYFFKYFRL